MARKSRQNASNRVTLTPRVVVEGALSLAEAEGLGAVTIRRLAEGLGVTPMALYWHFRSKDELLDGMAASIFEEVDLSVDASARWQEQLRALLGSMLCVNKTTKQSQTTYCSVFFDAAYLAVAMEPAGSTVGARGVRTALDSEEHYRARA